MSNLQRNIRSARHKIVSKLPSEEKTRVKNACSTALSATKTAIQIVQSITSDLGVPAPGLQSGLSGLLFVLSVVQASLHYTNTMDPKPGT